MEGVTNKDEWHTWRPTRTSWYNFDNAQQQYAAPNSSSSSSSSTQQQHAGSSTQKVARRKQHAAARGCKNQENGDKKEDE